MVGARTFERDGLHGNRADHPDQLPSFTDTGLETDSYHGRLARSTKTRGKDGRKVALLCSDFGTHFSTCVRSYQVATERRQPVFPSRNLNVKATVQGSATLIINIVRMKEFWDYFYIIAMQCYRYLIYQLQVSTQHEGGKIIAASSI